MWKKIFLTVVAYMTINTWKYQRSCFVIVLVLFLFFGDALCFCLFVFFLIASLLKYPPPPPLHFLPSECVCVLQA